MKKIIMGIVISVCLFQACAPAEPKTYNAAVRDKNPSARVQGDGRIKLGCNLSWFVAWDIASSSSLPAQGNALYGPGQVSDFNIRTAWVEGANGPGIGEWIEYTFKDKDGVKTDPALTVGSVSIFNGYAKNEKVWKNNNRVKTLRVEQNGKKICRLHFEDSVFMQITDFRSVSAAPGNRLRFVIEEVYKGEKDDDTAITEIMFEDGNCLGEE